MDKNKKSRIMTDRIGEAKFWDLMKSAESNGQCLS